MKAPTSTLHWRHPHPSEGSYTTMGEGKYQKEEEEEGGKQRTTTPNIEKEDMQQRKLG